MGRFAVPSLPDPAWEEEFERSAAMRDARCFDCDEIRRIPHQHGDPMHGYCKALDDWVSCRDKVMETKCEFFEWRKW